MTYDYKKIKKQVLAESELYTRFGPTRIWTFVLVLCRNNAEDAKSFMLSPEGGYSTKELDRIISQKIKHQEIYTKKLQCGLEVS